MPSFLDPSDFLYRVIEPDYWESVDNRIKIAPDAFEDFRQTDRETLCFFSGSVKSPADTLRQLARRGSTRKRCGKPKNQTPSPEEMYAAGYRIAVISARIVLGAAQASSMEIQNYAGGGNVDPDGHFAIYDGHKLSLGFARLARLLTKDETFPKT
jgi:hypothetical protein